MIDAHFSFVEGKPRIPQLVNPYRANLGVHPNFYKGRNPIFSVE